MAAFYTVTIAVVVCAGLAVLVAALPGVPRPATKAARELERV